MWRVASIFKMTVVRNVSVLVVLIIITTLGATVSGCDASDPFAPWTTSTTTNPTTQVTETPTATPSPAPTESPLPSIDITSTTPASAEAEQFFQEGVDFVVHKQWVDAIASIREALKLVPGSAEYTRVLAQAYAGLAQDEYGNDLTMAIVNSTRAIELDPTHVEYFLLRGKSYEATADQFLDANSTADEQANLFLAIEDYTSGLAFSPKSDELHYRRGDCYRRTSQWEKSVEDYSVVVGTANTWRGMAYYYRAIDYQILKNQKNAIADFKKAAQYVDDPDLATICQKSAVELTALWTLDHIEITSIDTYYANTDPAADGIVFRIAFNTDRNIHINFTDVSLEIQVSLLGYPTSEAYADTTDESKVYSTVLSVTYNSTSGLGDEIKIPYSRFRIDKTQLAQEGRIEITVVTTALGEFSSRSGPALLYTINH